MTTWQRGAQRAPTSHPTTYEGTKGNRGDIGHDVGWQPEQGALSRLPLPRVPVEEACRLCQVLTLARLVHQRIEPSPQPVAWGRCGAIVRLRIESQRGWHLGHVASRQVPGEHPAPQPERLPLSVLCHQLPVRGWPLFSVGEGGSIRLVARNGCSCFV